MEEQTDLQGLDFGQIYLISRWYNEVPGVLNEIRQGFSDGQDREVAGEIEKRIDLCTDEISMTKMDLVQMRWDVHTWFKHGERQKLRDFIANYIYNDTVYQFIESLWNPVGASILKFCEEKQEFLSPRELDQMLFEKYAPDSIDEIGRYDSQDSLGIIIMKGSKAIKFTMFHKPSIFTAEDYEEMGLNEIIDYVNTIKTEPDIKNSEIIKYGAEYAKEKGIQFITKEITKEYQRDVDIAVSAGTSWEQRDEKDEPWLTFEIMNSQTQNDLIVASKTHKINLKELEEYILKKKIENEFLSRGYDNFSLVKCNNEDLFGYFMFKYVVGTIGKDVASNLEKERRIINDPK